MICTHGYLPSLCLECQREEIQDKKQAKKRVPIKKLKNRSREQEREIAANYKAAGFPHSRRVPMSGAIATMKGDVDLGELFLVEAKLTRSGQLIIKHDWLEQVQKQSKDMGRAGFYV